jgi:anaerobic selenocysteine-containing dehydrogenase
MTERRRTWCGLCHSKCGIVLEFEDGRAVRVLGDPDHPINRGRICARGQLMVDHLYHPDRLNRARRRVGGRGEGRWEEIPYDRALDEVAARLGELRDRHGPETLSFCHGTARTYHWDQRRFFNLFGSPNYFGANNICMCPSVAVDYATYGCTTPHGDVDRARCIVVAGAAPSRSHPLLDYPRLLAAKKRGAKLVVVDPRRIPEADQADL